MEERHGDCPQALLSPPHSDRRFAPRRLRSKLNRALGLGSILLFCLAPWIPGCHPETGWEALGLDRQPDPLAAVEEQKKAMATIDAAPDVKAKLALLSGEFFSRIFEGSLFGVLVASVALVLV